MIDPLNVKITYKTKSEIEAEANNILRSYWDSTLPIDVEAICEFDLRLKLSPIPGLRNFTYDGFLPRNINEIFWDPDVVKVRTRFTIAHELGHFLLHNHVTKELIFNNYEEWIDFCSKIPIEQRMAAESQANTFAAKLLAPKDMIIQEIIKLEKDIRNAIKLVGYEDSALIIDYITVSLAKTFEVSEDCMKIRIESENINPLDYI